jgi:predicted transposase/invertase (TIGR01784 family)
LQKTYDITLKFLSGKFPEHFVSLIFDEFEGDVMPLDKELPYSGHDSDYVVKIEDSRADCEDDKFILHIEFQSTRDSNMPRRMMSYYARIVDKYGLPVYPVVIYLNSDNFGPNTPDTYVNSIYNEDIMKFKYRVLKVWEMDPKMIIDKDLYGLFPILPLTNHGNTNDNKCLEACFDLVQNADIKDEALKADMSVCTGVLAGLRYPKELVKSLMKVEIMQESVIYQDILNEGIEKGKKEGMEKGMEESIIYVLSARFGNISANMIDMIHHIRNKSRLNELLKLAATSRTITEFEQKIRTA